MSAIAATRGAYREMADGSLEVRIIVEPRDIPEFHRLFREKGMTMGIAPLTADFDRPSSAPEAPASDSNGKADTDVASEEGNLKGGALSRLAGIWCNDAQFYTFIVPVYDRYMGGSGSGLGDLDTESMDLMDPSNVCRHAILVMCNIESRAELDHEPEAAHLFHTLVREPYATWLKARAA